MTVLRQIREATSRQHELLEERWNLVQGLLCVENRWKIVGAFYEVHAPSELALLPWLRGVPDLDYEQRLKAPLLQADLTALGVSEPELATADAKFPQIENRAMALGLAYVLEGSTLGGQIIRKAVIAARGSLVGLSFFGAYGGDTGRRWKQFCHVLERECSTCLDECTGGAMAGFDFVSTALRRRLDSSERPTGAIARGAAIAGM